MEATMTTKKTKKTKKTKLTIRSLRGSTFTGSLVDRWHDLSGIEWVRVQITDSSFVVPAVRLRAGERAPAHARWCVQQESA